jgi:hypothetical protein
VEEQDFGHGLPPQGVGMAGVGEVQWGFRVCERQE